MVSKILLLKLLLMVGFSKEEAKVMQCIAKWESGFNPLAVNINEDESVDYGLFQINSKWWIDTKHGCDQTRDQLFDPIENIKCAKKIFDISGFTAWVSYNTREECNPDLWMKTLKMEDLYLKETIQQGEDYD